jgi:hypothetical protein
MSDVSEPFVGEIEAYRAFEVEGPELLSIGLGAHLWQPGTNRARCHLAGKRLNSRTVWVNDPDDPSGLTKREEEQLHAHGRIPSLSCTCGFWVFRDETGCRAEFGDLDLVIGRVLIWGRAIEHDTGYRAEFARITALVTEHPSRFASVAAAYGIETVRPRTKAEEGITTAYLTMVDGDRVKLDVPVRDSDEVIGFFTVVPGIDVPEPVAHVTARFTPERVITEFRVHADDQEDDES